MTIKYIDIIHHTHTDYGYTEHPSISRELHKKNIDIALSAIKATAHNKAGEKFYWTAEVLLSVYDWWLEADETRRSELLEAIASGQFEVQGFAFHNTALLNDDCWDKMFDWIPEELWKKMKPVSGMQIDVNGIPSAGAMRAIQKGIKYLWVGPNSYNGAPPFNNPTAFKWMLPNGESILTWINAAYNDAHFLFNENWREGPIPNSNDLRYRQPVKGDYFRDDEASVRKAHELCLRNLQLIEGPPELSASFRKANEDPNTLRNWMGGYKYERLLCSLTNQWRVDNDPPFLPVMDFIKKWNELGLKPELRLTTPASAFMELEKEVGDNFPQYKGEWTDWWANGSASAPVEVASSRKAKRVVKVIKSEIFGKLDEKENKRLDEALKNMCMFDEHTWGAWSSISNPFSDYTRSQFCEKSIYAYRGLAQAQYLLAEKARESSVYNENGIYLTNPSEYPLKAWIELPSNCLRGEYTHLKNMTTGELIEITYCDGLLNFKRPAGPEDLSIENVSQTFADSAPRKTAKFWSGTLKPRSTEHFCLIKNQAIPTEKMNASVVENNLMFATDSLGWPESAIWKGMEAPLFNEGLGGFLSYSPVGFAPRWIMKDIFSIENKEERLSQREKFMRLENSVYSNNAIMEEQEFSIRIEQEFSHPSLKWGKRILELWKDEPKAKLTIKINRRSSMDPEMLYVKFPLPCENTIPFISNGGYAFKPGEGQLPGTCMDYYAIDGWANYSNDKGNWLWNSKEAPIITFEAPQALAKLKKLPKRTDILLSMVFDNSWDTNFVADSHGIMEFNYDLIWRDWVEEKDIGKIVENLTTEPIVAVRV